MKKSISLLLAIVLIVSLFAACGKGGGDADPESKAAKGKITADDLVGDWYMQSNAEKVTFDKDGRYTHYGFTQYYGDWEINGDKVVLTSELKGEWEIGKANKSVCLQKEGETLLHWEDLPWNSLSLNDTADDGTVQLKLDSVTFENSISRPAGMGDIVWDIFSDEIEPLSSGTVYAKIDFTVNNISKNEIVFDTERKCDFVVNYKDGFLFTTNSEATCYYIMGENYCILETSSSGKIHGAVSVQPLTSQQITLYIPCSEMVSTDTSSPLHVQFFHAFGTDAQYFDFEVR